MPCQPGPRTAPFARRGFLARMGRVDAPRDDARVTKERGTIRAVMYINLPRCLCSDALPAPQSAHVLVAGRRTARCGRRTRRRRTRRLENVVAIVTGAFLASLGLFVLASGGVITGGHGRAGPAARRHHSRAVRRHVPRGEPAVRRPGDPRQGLGVHPAVGSCPGPGLEVLRPPAARPGGRCASSRSTRPSSATCWPASASSWSSGTAPASAASTSSPCSARSVSGWRAGYVQMGLDLGVVLAFAAVSDLRLALASGPGAVLLNLVIADEPPSRALRRRLSGGRSDAGRANHGRSYR